MVGTYADAARALESVRTETFDDTLSWEGSSRYVFLINGVVYKVNNTGAGINFNEDEYEKICNLKNVLPEGIHYPETSMYSVCGENVIAMQYIDGQPLAECYCTQDEECNVDCMTPEVIDFLGHFLSDPGGFNVISNDDGYWIIDPA